MDELMKPKAVQVEVVGATVVRMGLGSVVCNWGTHGGVPCVFIEPVVGDPGSVGAKLADGEQSQIGMKHVSPGGVIIEFHDPKGAEVLIEDIRSALGQMEAQPAV